MDLKNNYQITISHGTKQLCFPYQSLPPYDKIIELAKSNFPYAGNHTIYYVDDEGDEVSVRSDMELTEAYRLAEHQGKRDVRLHLQREPASKELTETNNSVNPPRPELVHSIPPMRPELSSSFQRLVPDYGRSQVLDFRTAEESEILVKIQNKLTEFTSVVSHLAKAKEEQTIKMKHISEFENEISALSIEKNQVIQNLEETQHQKRDLEMELRSQTHKNKELTEQIFQMQESSKLQLKEHEEIVNKFRTEREMFQESIKQKTITIAAQDTSMATLKETLGKMGKELRKEKELKSELESKVELLRRELDSKTGEYLEMSRHIIDVQAQKESLTKKATSLERQLEQEHLERETLEQSLVHYQLQASISGGKIPFPEESRDHSETSGICVVKPDDKWPKEKVPEQSSMDALRWGAELTLLKSLGYSDQKKNLEYLTKHQDVEAVIKAIRDETIKVPPKRDLPNDISASDIQLLEAMGFLDLDENIELLRSHGNDISIVVEILLKQMK
jgi:myosin heavy subunit